MGGSGWICCVCAGGVTFAEGLAVGLLPGQHPAEVHAVAPLGLPLRVQRRVARQRGEGAAFALAAQPARVLLEPARLFSGAIDLGVQAPDFRLGESALHDHIPEQVLRAATQRPPR